MTKPLNPTPEQLQAFRARQNARVKASYKRHPERVRAYKKLWRARNPEKYAAECARHQRRVQHRKYGFSLEMFNEMVFERAGLCDSCGRLPTDGRDLCVDHNHVNGKVRGLLCSDCNKALGFLKDDPDRAVRAAEYLRRTA